ncbi:hypothetical protein ABZ504_52885 [Streptomyces mirabilis]|uniref:hypothetical protein n=1 Tax=Streptomyces mirabilis TaxID=68239 RepID=UPI0033C4EF14
MSRPTRLLAGFIFATATLLGSTSAAHADTGVTFPDCVKGGGTPTADLPRLICEGGTHNGKVVFMF